MESGIGVFQAFRIPLLGIEFLQLYRILQFLELLVGCPFRHPSGGQPLQAHPNFADILKINDEELVIAAQMFGIPGDTKDILRALKEKFCLKSIILTLGANGSMFFDGENFTSYPVCPCNVVDTVGCGDSFLAGWCCAILNGKSPDEAMRIGSEISAYVASHAGGMC